MADAVPQPCPICRRPALARFRPFCSARCADRDLGNWLTESYRIPAGPIPSAAAEDEEEEGA